MNSLDNTPLQIKYRPLEFDEVVGNKAIVESLKSIVARKEGRPHSYLFTGPSGCGKTTLARILAKALGCSELEFHEYDTSNVRGIENIQEIKQQSFFSPLSGNIRVNLWDEAHEITKKGAEAMLKFLEDTPDHLYNILCTTNPEKIPITIKRRCHSYTVSTLTSHEMEKVLGWVLGNENVILPQSVRTALVVASDGCPGIMLKKLDQIIDIQGEKNQLEGIENTTSDNVQIIDICRKLIAKEGGVKKWSELSDMLKNFDLDPESTRRAILGYLSKVLLSNKGEEGKRIALIMAEFVNNYYDTGKSGLVVSCYIACWV